MAKDNTIRLYMKPEDQAKMTHLAERLIAEGIDLRDQRGNVSLSALVRHLVDEALKNAGADNTSES